MNNENIWARGIWADDIALLDGSDAKSNALDGYTPIIVGRMG